MAPPLLISTLYVSGRGRAIAEAVIRWLPTAAVRVRAQTNYRPVLSSERVLHKDKTVTVLTAPDGVI
jgi:hypothetical protein